MKIYIWTYQEETSERSLLAVSETLQGAIEEANREFWSRFDQEWQRESAGQLLAKIMKSDPVILDYPNAIYTEEFYS